VFWAHFPEDGPSAILLALGFPLVDCTGVGAEVLCSDVCGSAAGLFCKDLIFRLKSKILMLRTNRRTSIPQMIMDQIKYARSAKGGMNEFAGEYIVTKTSV